MKKLFALTALTTLAALASSAQANSIGVSLGYPSSVQYTLDDVLGNNIDLRLTGKITPDGGDLGFGFDTIYRRPGGNSNLSTYFGIGTTYTLSGSLDFVSIGGVDYKLDSNISLFLDVSTGVRYSLNTSGVDTTFGAGVGVKFRL